MRGRWLLVLVAGLVALVAASAAAAMRHDDGGGVTRFKDRLAAVPHTAVPDTAAGKATLKLDAAGVLTVKVKAEGLSPDLHHLIHIHGLAQGVAECPPMQADVDHDGLISFGEGAPFYGPVRVSFTTSGDTSPASGGALDRMPFAADEGKFTYRRTFGIPSTIASRLAEHVIVIHGLDLNGNGRYDNATELTVPVACGPIVQVSEDDDSGD